MALTVIVGCLVGFVLVLGVLLTIPVDLALVIRRKKHFHSELRVRWLLGAFQTTHVPGRRPAAERRKPGKRPIAKGKRGPARWPRYLRAAIRTEGLFPRILRFVPQLLQNLRIRDLFLNLRVGLDDPALTGEFYGGLCAVLVPMQALPGSCVLVKPEFDGMVLDGEFETELRIIPARLLQTMLAFVLSPPILRAGQAVIRERFR